MNKNVKRVLKVIGSIIIVIAGIILGFTACTSTSNVPPQVSAEKSTVIPDSKPLSAKEITDELKKAKLPIGKIVVATEKNDENKLLGRPNQYISKANFADTRAKQFEDSDPVGGSVETFSNVDDLTTRKEYVESIEKHMPATTQYIITNGKYMLRLDKDITPSQVTEYKSVFMKLK